MEANLLCNDQALWTSFKLVALCPFVLLCFGSGFGFKDFWIEDLSRSLKCVSIIT